MSLAALGETSYVGHGSAHTCPPGTSSQGMHLQFAPNSAQSALLVQVEATEPRPQKPSPSMVGRQRQSSLLWQGIALVLSHGVAQRQGEAGSAGILVPPFLRHLHLALHLRLASASRGNSEGTTAPRSAPPASFSALPLEMVPLSRPFARSSKNCSPIGLSPLFPSPFPKGRDTRGLAPPR